MTITSPHNDQLKEIRKLAGRKWRDKLGQFVAEGEDLLDAADAAGWEPLARLVAEGSGLEGEEVKPHLLAQVSQLGSGTRALARRGGDPLAREGDTTRVVGAERGGLPDGVVAACDATATIPVRAESLNAAMAATVALYECNRRMAA